jgi:urate oxidase
MKNTVYALAKKHSFDSPEGFGKILSEHFVAKFPQVSAATVTIEQTLWERIAIGGKRHEHAFVKGSDAKRTAVVRRERPEEFLVQGGIKGLEVMKTTKSGFVGFLRDEYTTLKETTERIFGTSVEANWILESADADFNAAFDTARRVILEVFATHDSLGVQQTIFEMGKQVLAAVPAIKQISFTMPNQHRLLANLEPFGMSNENEVFINTSEPFGFIKGTIVREGT